MNRRSLLQQGALLTGAGLAGVVPLFESKAKAAPEKTGYNGWLIGMDTFPIRVRLLFLSIQTEVTHHGDQFHRGERSIRGMLAPLTLDAPTLEQYLREETSLSIILDSAPFQQMPDPIHLDGVKLQSFLSDLKGVVTEAAREYGLTARLAEVILPNGHRPEEVYAFTAESFRRTTWV